MFTEILGLLGSGLSIGGGLFGGEKGNNAVDSAETYFSYMENELRRKQMNLDANRRKRDIIRQSQIATANAEAAASNSGALRSSGVEGARASISGQSGVNFLGVSQNQEIGNIMFNYENQRLKVKFDAKQSRKTGPQVGDILGMAGKFFSGDAGSRLAKLGQWGAGTFSEI